MTDVRGEIWAAGPGVRVRLRGDGAVLRADVAGALPGGRGRAAAVADRLAGAGVRLDVHDGAGRALASAGASVCSPLGRLLTGSAAVRPTARGLVALARRRARAGAARPHDHDHDHDRGGIPMLDATMTPAPPRPPPAAIRRPAGPAG